MEPIFENVYIDTEEIIREQFAYRRRWARIILGIIFSAWTVFFAVELFLDPSVFRVLLIVYCVGYAVYLLFLPRIQAKKYLKRELAEYGGVLPHTVVRFCENEVTEEYGRSTNTVPYEKINEIITLNHTIILRVKKVTAVAISPNHFTKGSVEQMYRFLQMKCPELKLPGWKW